MGLVERVFNPAGVVLAPHRARVSDNLLSLCLCGYLQWTLLFWGDLTKQSINQSKHICKAP